MANWGEPDVAYDIKFGESTIVKSEPPTEMSFFGFSAVINCDVTARFIIVFF